MVIGDKLELNVKASVSITLMNLKTAVDHLFSQTLG